MATFVPIRAPSSPYAIPAGAPVPIFVDTGIGTVRLDLPADPTGALANNYKLPVWKTSLDTTKITVRPSGAQRINALGLGVDLDPVPGSTTGGVVLLFEIVYSGVSGLWIVR